MSIKVPNTKITKASVYLEAGEARFEEAKFLLDRFPSAAIYLAGYLVECYLKWALCKRQGIEYLQDHPNSDLAGLLTSGQGHNLERLCDITNYDVHFSGNHDVQRAFSVTAVWSPNLRYVKSCGGTREAVQFLAAVAVLRDDIRSWANN